MHSEWKAAKAAAYQHIHHDDGDPAKRYMPEPMQRGTLRYVDLDGRWQVTACATHQAEMNDRRSRYLGMRQRGLGHEKARDLAIKGHA